MSPLRVYVYIHIYIYIFFVLHTYILHTYIPNHIHASIHVKYANFPIFNFVVVFNSSTDFCTLPWLLTPLWISLKNFVASLPAQAKMVVGPPGKM